MSDVLSGDMFDIRDVMKRFEELEEDEERDEEDEAEFQEIKAFLEEVKGYGGDEQWRGDWYPVGFISDSYFEEYAEELADDIGAINKDARWPTNHIDWKAAAEELRQGYSSVEVDGVTYWYR